VNVTDGRYVYMRAGAQPGNQPLYEYTLMPTAMRSRFPVDVLRRAELVEPFSFTRDVPVLRLPGFAYTDPYAFGTMLFDLHTDPDQRTGLVDDALELRMATLLRDLMRASDAPPEQYVRLGLPEAGPLRHEHLLVRVQAEQQVTARQVPVTDADFPQSRLSVRTPLADLLADPEAVAVLRRHLGEMVDNALPPEAMPMTLLEITNLAVGLIPAPTLHAIAKDLAKL